MLVALARQLSSRSLPQLLSLSQYLSCTSSVIHSASILTSSTPSALLLDGRSGRSGQGCLHQQNWCQQLASQHLATASNQQQPLTLKAALRQLYKRVHPDLFADYPAEQVSATRSQTTAIGSCVAHTLEPQEWSPFALCPVCTHYSFLEIDVSFSAAG